MNKIDVINVFKNKNTLNNCMYYSLFIYLFVIYIFKSELKFWKTCHAVK
jgi:hypothetical protein